MPSSLPLPRPVAAGAVGAVAGAISGLFGVGGGIVMVPLLVLALGVPQRRAHGTSVTATLPIALAGVSGFWLEGRVDWPVAFVVVLGAVPGAVIGAQLLAKVPTTLLTYGFVATLAVSALRLALAQPDAVGRPDLTFAGAALLVLVGVAAGLAAGLLGVGGGIVMVPALVLFVGLPAAVAKGTSLAVIVPTSVAATLRNRANGNSDTRLGALIGVAGMVSAYVATTVAVTLDERAARFLLASLLALVAAHLAFRTWRTRPGSDSLSTDVADPIVSGEECP